MELSIAEENSMYIFNVTFSRNNWKNTLNPDDVVVIMVESTDFYKARRIARRKATENGYSGRDGWRWYSTRFIKEA